MNSRFIGDPVRFFSRSMTFLISHRNSFYPLGILLFVFLVTQGQLAYNCCSNYGSSPKGTGTSSALLPNQPLPLDRNMEVIRKSEGEATSTYTVMNWLYSWGSVVWDSSLAAPILGEVAQSGYLAAKLPNTATVGNDIHCRYTYRTLPDGADPNAPDIDAWRAASTPGFTDYQVVLRNDLAATVESLYPSGPDHYWAVWSPAQGQSLNLPDKPFMDPELEIFFDITIPTGTKMIDADIMAFLGGLTFGPLQETVRTDFNTRHLVEFWDRHSESPPKEGRIFDENEPIEVYHWLCNCSNIDRTFAVDVSSQVWGLTGFEFFDGTYDDNTNTFTKGQKIDPTSVAVPKYSQTNRNCPGWDPTCFGCNCRLLIITNSGSPGTRTDPDVLIVYAEDKQNPSVNAEGASVISGPYLDPSISYKTVYVDPAGTCGGKKPCFSSIQAAIAAADPDATVKIAQGTYQENIQTDQAKNLTFECLDEAYMNPGLPILHGSASFAAGTSFFTAGSFILMP